MKKYKMTKEGNSEDLIVSFEGVLDDSVEFEKDIGPAPKKLTIDCSRILHINSSLVKPWLLYFHRIRTEGTDLHFKACPTPVIDYFNLIPSFTCGGKIDSVLAPFFCKKCKREISVLLEIPGREILTLSLTGQKCPGCQSVAEFDDDEITYFAFLSK